MKRPGQFNVAASRSVTAAALFLLLSPTLARAQETPAQTPASPPSEAEVVRRSLARARALAAIGKLAAAAAELEALRASSREESARDVARVLLMSIYVEMPDYARAAALLDETFKARRGGQTNDAATAAYFALAGQTVNSVRQHLERYRSFGLNIADAELPAEASGDLEQLRGLLERVVEQAKGVWAERAGGADAMALLEDAATVRMRIARHGQDRARWQTEVSSARQQLFAAEMRLASVNSVPAGPPPADRPAPAPTQEPAAAQTTTATPPAARAAGPANAQTSAPAPAQPQVDATSSAPGAGQSQSAPGLLSVGSLNGLARARATPSYPPIARAARVTGVVTVYLIVNEEGEVESIERAEGPLQLQRAASEAARRWKFNQTVVNGQPVRVSGYLNFNFAL